MLPLLLVGVSGCKLIDQTTFAPEPEQPAPSQIAAIVQADRRAPLLTIRYDVPDPPYREALGGAVRAAETRNPAVEYDVISVVPPTPTASPSTLPTRGRKGASLPLSGSLSGEGGPQGRVGTPSAQDDAVEVMRSIMRLGVPDARIHLGLRTDPAATAREVRVYVR